MRRGKLRPEVQGAAGVGGRAVIDGLLSQPRAARGRAASQEDGTGGGTRLGGGEEPEEGRGGGRRSGAAAAQWRKSRRCSDRLVPLAVAGEFPAGAVGVSVFSGFGGWKMLQRDEAAAEEVAAAESATALGWRKGGSSGGGGGVRGPTTV